MKTMTCRKFGGACDKAFTADSFEEMAEMNMAHGMEIVSKTRYGTPRSNATNYGHDARP